MAILPTTRPTLMDLAQRLDPDGSVSAVIEIMNETLPILDQMTFREGNLVTGHKFTMRTGLPQPTWRRLNEGVQPTKAKTAQATAETGMLEDYAEVDKALADLNGNTAEFRLSEDRAHIEGIAQELARTLFYGNPGIDPARFMGLAMHYNDPNSASFENVIDAGGTGADNASIWLVGWSEATIFGIIPKGSKAGLQVDDKGQVTVENVDGNGGRMEAYRTHYRQDAGLCVADWRYAVRIANIDRSDLKKNAADGGADLIELMIDAVERMPADASSRTNLAFYMDRSMHGTIRHQIKNSTANSTLSVDTVAGRKLTMFDEIPVYRVDTLAVDEERVA